MGEIVPACAAETNVEILRARPIWLEGCTRAEDVRLASPPRASAECTPPEGPNVIVVRVNAFVLPHFWTTPSASDYPLVVDLILESAKEKRTTRVTTPRYCVGKCASIDAPLALRAELA